jgi:uncharacterized membrane protein YbhN (UPF0104 family)
MSEEFTKIESLLEQVREYANTRIDRAKLSIAEKTSGTMAVVIAGFATALVFFLFFVFGGIAAAIALGQLTGKAWLGFLIVAFVFLILALILWKLKDRLITIPIMNAIIRHLFTNEEEEPEDEKD